MEGLTPEDIRQEFRLYRKSSRDTLAEFLSHYHRLWVRANAFDLSGVEGILHLIPLLPIEWQNWATSIVPRYVDRSIWGNLYGDCRGFISKISKRYMCFDEPPPGPYGFPPDFVPRVFQPEAMPQDDQVPFSLQPFVPLSEPEIQEPHPYQAAFDPNSFMEDFSSAMDFVPSLPPLNVFTEEIQISVPVSEPISIPPENPVPYYRSMMLDPCLRGPILPSPSHPTFQALMHQYDPPNPKEFEAGGSRPSQKDSDDSDNEDPLTQVTVGKSSIKNIPPRALSFEHGSIRVDNDQLSSDSSEKSAEREPIDEAFPSDSDWGSHEEEFENTINEEKEPNEDEEEDPSEDEEEDPSEDSPSEAD